MRYSKKVTQTFKIKTLSAALIGVMLIQNNAHADCDGCVVGSVNAASAAITTTIVGTASGMMTFIEFTAGRLASEIAASTAITAKANEQIMSGALAKQMEMNAKMIMAQRNLSNPRIDDGQGRNPFNSNNECDSPVMAAVAKAGGSTQSQKTSGGGTKLKQHQGEQKNPADPVVKMMVAQDPTKNGFNKPIISVGVQEFIKPGGTRNAIDDALVTEYIKYAIDPTPPVNLELQDKKIAQTPQGMAYTQVYNERNAAMMPLNEITAELLGYYGASIDAKPFEEQLDADGKKILKERSSTDGKLSRDAYLDAMINLTRLDNPTYMSTLPSLSESELLNQLITINLVSASIAKKQLDLTARDLQIKTLALRSQLDQHYGPLLASLYNNALAAKGK